MLNAAAVPALSPAPQMQGANFLNLLILDDDRAVREASRDVGHSLGFSTHIAESAEQAYRMLDNNSIDAVLLELRAAGASGMKALHTIKRHRPDAVVIVLTGYGTVQSAVQAMKGWRLRLRHQTFQYGRTVLPAGTGRQASARQNGGSRAARDIPVAPGLR